jgi:hypothetical protein
LLFACFPAAAAGRIVRPAIRPAAQKSHRPRGAKLSLNAILCR